MQQEQSLKETIDRVMAKFPGDLLGSAILANAQYIKSRQGEEGLRRIEKKMAQLGHPFKFGEVKTFQYYSTGLADAVIIIAKELFNWQEKDIFEMGGSNVKLSFVTRLVVRRLLTLEKSLQKADQHWRKQNTEGRIKYRLDKRNKCLFLRFEFKSTHPLLCIFFAGFFAKITSYIIKGRISIKETRCAFQGAPFHEYLITWE